MWGSPYVNWPDTPWRRSAVAYMQDLAGDLLEPRRPMTGPVEDNLWWQIIEEVRLGWVLDRESICHWPLGATTAPLCIVYTVC